MSSNTKPARRLERRESPSPKLPTNWPADAEYLTDHTYSAAVTPELRAALSRTSSGSDTYIRILPELVAHPCPMAEIRIIDDVKHPARGQRGLFAAQQLDPDQFVCLYLGHVHTNSLSDSDPHSDYDLNLDRELGLSVDGVRSGNESRFTNDYRGIAERPNAEFRDCAVRVESLNRSGGVKWERRVGIFVLSAGRAAKRTAGIKPGEEILVNYGKSYWEARKTIAGFRRDFEMLKVAQDALDW